MALVRLVDRLALTDTLLARATDSGQRARMQRQSVSDAARTLEPFDPDTADSATRTKLRRAVVALLPRLNDYALESLPRLGETIGGAAEVARRVGTQGHEGEPAWLELDAAQADLDRESSTVAEIGKIADRALALTGQSRRAPTGTSATDRLLALRLHERARGMDTALVGQSMTLHFARLRVLGEPPALAASIHDLHDAALRVSQTVAAMHEGRDTKHQQVRDAVGLADRLLAAGERFGLAAAETWADQPAFERHWEAARALVQTLDRFAPALARLLEREAPFLDRRGAAEVAESVVIGGAQTPASASQPDAARPPPQQVRASPRRSAMPRARTARRAAPVAVEAPAPAAGIAATRDAVQALRKVARLTPADVQRHGADLAALAAALDPGGKRLDAAVLRSTAAHASDPATVATVSRTLAQTWFGHAANWRRLQSSLGSAPASGADGPAAASASAAGQVAQQAEALEALLTAIAAAESDALKRLERPRAPHLRRLLALGEIARVTSPQVLPSHGDTVDRARLFELRIEPKPLADGRAAAPLFLHLHMRAAIDPATSVDLDFDAVAAAHIKTERQRTLGARWELIERGLGRFEALVHRGRVDAELWRSLRSRLVSADI